MDNKKYWFFGSKLNTVLLLILIILMIIALKWMAQDKDKYLPSVPAVHQEDDTTKIKDSYTYTNHGFSIELPKGYIPEENPNARGNRTEISLPNSQITYATDATFWENNSGSHFKYLKDEKIGETTFKVYQNGEFTLYWFKQGNVGYEYAGDIELLKTFKFVGWPQVEGDKDNLVSFSIKPGQEVSGIVKATGVIKGGYFFEGNLPISILDSNKNLTKYGPGHGQATTDWMTAGPVSFETSFDFTKMPKGNFYIKIMQDDPSGGESGNPIKFVLIPIVIK